MVSLISLAFAMLVLAVSPGPGVFATVARSLTSGFRPALAVICGLVIGDIIFLLFSIYGLSFVAQTFGKLFFLVRICAGAYLFWLGLKMWFSEPLAPESNEWENQKIQSGNIVSGLLITLSNPKVILFYCSFLPAFIDLSTLKILDISLIICIVIFVLSSVLMIYAYLASYSRRFINSKIVPEKLNRCAAAVMMATGIVIVAKN
ncbi:MAG: LysE family translocator [Desulfobacteraceae bacterium]|nr:LysE family translocator [Desulfobacteraceae bacterium]